MMETGNADQAKAAVEAYQALTAQGVEVLLDDREQSPGAKLKDADLVGIPVQVVVGKVWQNDRQLEVTWRATKEKTRVAPSGLVDSVCKLLDRSPLRS